MKYPMRLEDLIYVIPNAMDYICDTLIEHHTKMCNRGLGIDIDKKDDKMGIDIKISQAFFYFFNMYYWYMYPLGGKLYIVIIKSFKIVLKNFINQLFTIISIV